MNPFTLLFILFVVSEKVKVYKKLSTAVFGGLMVFAILTKKISAWDEKTVLIVVLGLLIFAVNMKLTPTISAGTTNPEDQKESKEIQ